MPDLSITWPENDGWKMEDEFWRGHVGHVMTLIDAVGPFDFTLRELHRDDSGWLTLVGDRYVSFYGADEDGEGETYPTEIAAARLYGVRFY